MRKGFPSNSLSKPFIAIKGFLELCFLYEANLNLLFLSKEATRRTFAYRQVAFCISLPLGEGAEERGG